MNLYTHRVVATALLAIAVFAPASAQEPASGNLVFRSSVDVVSVTAVVRDRRGHVVSTLTRDEFEVVDAGQKRPIIDLQNDSSAPTSVALLVDGSGSMRMGGALDSSRTIASAVLGSLDRRRDDAALMTFDRRLVTVHDFTHDFDKIETSLGQVEAWGSTSLYDAIAGAAGIVGERARNRRAIIVLTDGADNASDYTPEEVAYIASTIDVPVYVFSLAASETMGPNDRVTAPRRSVLAELAHATGGDFFPADSPKLVAAGIARLVEELRHQYVISFEASSFDGLRRVEIRTRRNELKVRSRSWYSARPGE